MNSVHRLLCRQFDLECNLDTDVTVGKNGETGLGIYSETLPTEFQEGKENWKERLAWLREAGR